MIAAAATMTTPMPEATSVRRDGPDDDDDSVCISLSLVGAKLVFDRCFIRERRAKTSFAPTEQNHIQRIASLQIPSVPIAKEEIRRTGGSLLSMEGLEVVEDPERGLRDAQLRLRFRQ